MRSLQIVLVCRLVGAGLFLVMATSCIYHLRLATRLLLAIARKSVALPGPKTLYFSKSDAAGSRARSGEPSRLYSRYLNAFAIVLMSLIAMGWLTYIAFLHLGLVLSSSPVGLLAAMVLNGALWYSAARIAKKYESVVEWALVVRADSSRDTDEADAVTAQSFVALRRGIRRALPTVPEGL